MCIVCASVGDYVLLWMYLCWVLECMLALHICDTLVDKTFLGLELEKGALGVWALDSARAVINFVQNFPCIIHTIKMVSRHKNKQATSGTLTGRNLEQELDHFDGQTWEQQAG